MLNTNTAEKSPGNVGLEPSSADYFNFGKSMPALVMGEADEEDAFVYPRSACMPKPPELYTPPRLTHRQRSSTMHMLPSESPEPQRRPMSDAISLNELEPTNLKPASSISSLLTIGGEAILRRVSRGILASRQCSVEDSLAFSDSAPSPETVKELSKLNPQGTVWLESAQPSCFLPPTVVPVSDLASLSGKLPGNYSRGLKQRNSITPLYSSHTSLLLTDTNINQRSIPSPCKTKPQRNS